MEEPSHKERKRSKRHRIQRNHISVKDSVDCIIAFAQYARDVQKKDKARFAKQTI